jgi:hypothetical protein
MDQKIATDGIGSKSGRPSEIMAPITQSSQRGGCYRPKAWFLVR